MSWFAAIIDTIAVHGEPPFEATVDVTLDVLIEKLADIVDQPEADVRWLARKLQAAGLLPAEADALVEPLHAARLLAAVMGTGRPLDAVATVQTYEKTPASLWIDKDTATQMTGTRLIEDVQIPTSRGRGAVAMSRNFVSAVAHLIENCPDDHPVPDWITVRRDLDHPLARILDMSGPDNGRPTSATMVFARRHEPVEMPPRLPSFEVSGAVTGSAITRLAVLFKCRDVAEVSVAETGE